MAGPVNAQPLSHASLICIKKCKAPNVPLAATEITWNAMFACPMLQTESFIHFPPTRPVNDESDLACLLGAGHRELWGGRKRYLLEAAGGGLPRALAGPCPTSRLPWRRNENHVPLGLCTGVGRLWVQFQMGPYIAFTVRCSLVPTGGKCFSFSASSLLSSSRQCQQVGGRDHLIKGKSPWDLVEGRCSLAWILTAHGVPHSSSTKRCKAVAASMGGEVSAPRRCLSLPPVCPKTPGGLT